MIELIFLSGSSQVGSANWQLPHVAAELTTRTFGALANVDVVDLNMFDLPNYSEVETNIEDGRTKVTDLWLKLSRADGLFVSSDEYTGTYSTVLKNALKWLSVLGIDNDTPLREMPIGLCGTSSRGVGALRGQPALAQLLTELGAVVISHYLELGTAPKIYDDGGRLFPRFERQLIDGCLAKLVEAGKRRNAA